MTHNILYTIGCPACLRLEKKLMDNNIPFTKCEDKSKMAELNLDALPVLEVDGQLLSFLQAWKWATNYEVNNGNKD